MQIFGPWYTFDEALELLQIRASELKYLLQQKAIQPVIYSTQRTWLLHKRSKAGWTGYGLCQYRGAVQAHPEFVAKLLDDENAVIGSGGGILLEPDNITRVTSSYPYTRELPHPPLIAWKTETASPEEIKSCIATPAPEEVTPISHITEGFKHTLEMLCDSSSPKQPWFTTKEAQDPKKKYQLSFSKGAPFQPSDIRIPKSQIERYQRENAVGVPLDKETRKKRSNALHEILYELIQAHPKVQDKKLWAMLQKDCEADIPKFNGAGVITEMDDLCIEWTDSKGAPQSLKRGSFSSTLSRLRNPK